MIECVFQRKRRQRAAKMGLNGMHSRENARFDEYTRKNPEGALADEFFGSFWTPKHDEVIPKAKALFAKLSDGKRSEDDVWKEVWQIMNNEAKQPEKTRVNGSNADTNTFKQRRGRNFGRQEYEPQYEYNPERVFTPNDRL